MTPNDELDVEGSRCDAFVIPAFNRSDWLNFGFESPSVFL
jgi:hypothetical protein